MDTVYLRSTMCQRRRLIAVFSAENGTCVYLQESSQGAYNWQVCCLKSSKRAFFLQKSNRNALCHWITQPAVTSLRLCLWSLNFTVFYSARKVRLLWILCVLFCYFRVLRGPRIWAGAGGRVLRGPPMLRWRRRLRKRKNGTVRQYRYILCLPHQTIISFTCRLDLTRPSGFFGCRSHSLELSPGFHPGPDHQFGLFQAAA